MFLHIGEGKVISKKNNKNRLKVISINYVEMILKNILFRLFILMKERCEHRN